MPSRHPKQLLRTSSCLPGQRQQVSKVLVADMPQNQRMLFGRDVMLAFVGCGRPACRIGLRSMCPLFSAQLKARFMATTTLRLVVLPQPGWASIQSVTWSGFNSATLSVGYFKTKDQLLHEFVAASKRLISVRTEIDLLAVQLDIPEPAILTKERLRKMRHDKPPL